MPTAGFELTISVGKRAQTYELDRTATETGSYFYHGLFKFIRNL